jgi:hypothetical protein
LAKANEQVIRSVESWSGFAEFDAQLAYPKGPWQIEFGSKENNVFRRSLLKDMAKDGLNYLKFLFVITLFFGSEARAEKCAFLITHEGQGIRRSTMPVETQNYLDGLKAANWSIQSFYDKNLKQKYGDLTNLEGVEVATSSLSDLQRGFNRLIEKPCEQVLLVGITHGTCGSSHGWELEGGNFPLKNMKPMIEKLKLKGSKVAIIDQSCYSGNAIDVLEKEVDCVMATSGRYQKTYDLATQTLSQQIKYQLIHKSSDKHSLHDLFLFYVCDSLASQSPDISSLKIYQEYDLSCTTDWARPLKGSEKSLLHDITRIVSHDQPMKSLSKFGCSTKKEDLFGLINELATSDDTLLLFPEQVGSVAMIRTALKLAHEKNEQKSPHGCLDFFLN